jgi:hypothetical protein
LTCGSAQPRNSRASAALGEAHHAQLHRELVLHGIQAALVGAGNQAVHAVEEVDHELVPPVPHRAVSRAAATI